MTQDIKNTVSKTPSGSEGTKAREKDKSLQSKVVIRRLPPTMTEAQFLDQISPVPASDYMYFVKADPSLGANSFCRAYISFLNQEDIFIFKEKFDTYVFVDSKGNEFPAIVEFAPFQKIPKKRSKKRDAKCGTLETDTDYLKFLENLENPEEEVNLPSAESYLEEIEIRERELKTNGSKQTTPLIEYLKQRKIDRQRIKDEKREERRRKDMERKKAREEERRKRKNEKDIDCKDSAGKKDGHISDEGLKLTLLKNPEREDGPTQSPTTASKSTTNKTPQHYSGSSSHKEYPALRGGYRDRDRNERGGDRVRKHDRQTEKQRTEKTLLSTRDRNKVHREERIKTHKDASTKATNRSEESTSSKASIIAEDPAVLEAAVEKHRKSPIENESSAEGTKNSPDFSFHSKEKGEGGGKDPRTERRIKNKVIIYLVRLHSSITLPTVSACLLRLLTKFTYTSPKDRPSLEIYRPGMRRISTQRSSPQKETPSVSNSGASSPAEASPPDNPLEKED